jgi:hypothetical protein
MLRALPKTTQLFFNQHIKRGFYSTPTQLIKRHTTAYKEDHTIHKNKAENNKPTPPPKKLTAEERIRRDLERANRIEEARYLYARPGQKNK